MMRVLLLSFVLFVYAVGSSPTFSNPDYFLYNRNPAVSNLGYSITVKDHVFGYGQKHYAYGTYNSNDIYMNGNEFDVATETTFGRNELITTITSNGTMLVAGSKLVKVYALNSQLEWDPQGDITSLSLFNLSSSQVVFQNYGVGGSTLVISGTRIVSGSALPTGFAVIVERNGSIWHNTATLEAPDGSVTFGQGIAVYNGDKCVALGNPGEKTVQLFQKSEVSLSS